MSISYPMNGTPSAGQPSDYQERRLVRAVEHVSKHWLPYNPSVLESIRRGVDEGRYELGGEFLLVDLKQDLGLFSYCLREILHERRATNAVHVLSNPEDCFEGISSAQILSLLGKAERALSSHSLKNTKDSQAAQLRFTVLSAAAAEVLASRTELDSELAFVASLFRQLGLLLVAWNYPTVFERAQRSVSPERTLDEELEAQLGFSPELLGHAVFKEFLPGPELEYAVMGASAVEVPPLEISRSSEQLAEICRVSEVLAQANDPERYPQAQSTWSEAREAIGKSLGADGMRLIRDAVARYSAAYREVSAPLFGELAEIDPERKIEQARRAGTLRANPFVERCPLHIRQRLVEFYSKLHEGLDPRSAVAALLAQVIPVTGFEAGIISTIEPSRMELVPRLKFGEIQLRRVMALRYSDRRATDDPLLAALAMPTPYVSRSEGAGRAFLVGGLGGEKAIGVFYAECSTELLDRAEFEPLVVFKAVLRSFEDALGLKRG
jgi:hypothetical protein